MIKNGEIRALIDPEKFRSIIDKLSKKRIRLSEGLDTYFNKKFFEKGYQLRVRKQTFFYPKREEKYSITLKTHYPNFRNMNFYNSLTVMIDSSKDATELLRKMFGKEIFVEVWKNCEEFKINGIKVEFFYLKGWDWLVEFEEVVKNSKEKTYNKLLKIIALFNLEEKDLILTEPAEYIFKRKLNVKYTKDWFEQRKIF